MLAAILENMQLLFLLFNFPSDTSYEWALGLPLYLTAEQRYISL